MLRNLALWISLRPFEKREIMYKAMIGPCSEKDNNFIVVF